MALSAPYLAHPAPAGLADAAACLPDPHNYYHGRSAPQLALPEDVLLFCRRSPAALGHRPGIHHRFVLVVPLIGCADVVVDRRPYRLVPRQAALVFPYQFHAYRAVPRKRLRWLFLTFLVQHEATLSGLRDRVLTLDGHALHMISKLIDGWQTGPKHTATIQVQLACLLHDLISRCPSRGGRTSRDAEPAFIKNLADFVFEHLDAPIPVEWLARELAMSPSALRQRVRHDLGVSVSSYVRRIKLLHAMKLLRGTDISVTDIADACGYSSVYAFSRGFKQEIGVSPRTYRTQPA